MLTDWLNTSCCFYDISYVHGNLKSGNVLVSAVVDTQSIIASVSIGIGLCLILLCARTMQLDADLTVKVADIGLLKLKSFIEVFMGNCK